MDDERMAQREEREERTVRAASKVWALRELLADVSPARWEVAPGVGREVIVGAPYDGTQIRRWIAGEANAGDTRGIVALRNLADAMADVVDEAVGAWGLMEAGEMDEHASLCLAVEELLEAIDRELPGPGRAPPREAETEEG